MAASPETVVIKMPEDEKTGLLQGRDEICHFLKISRPTFFKFVSWGMPARLHEGRWYAHRRTLEVWFERWTNICSSKIIAQAEEIEEEEK